MGTTRIKTSRFNFITWGSGKVIYNYDDPAEFGLVIVEEHSVEDQDHHVDTEMADTYHDYDSVWLHDEEKHEDTQGWGQWQQNSWTQHGTTYGNNSGVGSSGEESSIITLLENMCVEQHERHQEDSRRCDAFEASQEERFILVQERMNAQDTNFNNFSMYATKQFNQIREDMEFNHRATHTCINNMIVLENDNHHHYQQQGDM